jgi:hypothetical protein
MYMIMDTATETATDTDIDMEQKRTFCLDNFNGQLAKMRER